MKMNEVKVIGKIFLFTIIPAGLTIISKSDFLLFLQKNQIIGSKCDIGVMNIILLILGIILSGIFLSINLGMKEIELKLVTRQRNYLIKFYKEIFLKAFYHETKLNNIGINIRIFIPDNLNKPKKFKIKNIEGLSEAGTTSNLFFKVDNIEKPEGLVGHCFKEKSIQWDKDVSNTEKDYNLSRFQTGKTSDLRFCLCAPIFNEKENIKAIMAFDSTYVCNISAVDEENMKKMITNFCQTFHDYLPELFK